MSVAVVVVVVRAVHSPGKGNARHVQVWRGASPQTLYSLYHTWLIPSLKAVVQPLVCISFRYAHTTPAFTHYSATVCVCVTVQTVPMVVQCQQRMVYADVVSHVHTTDSCTRQVLSHHVHTRTFGARCMSTETIFQTTILTI